MGRYNLSHLIEDQRLAVSRVLRTLRPLKRDLVTHPRFRSFLGSDRWRRSLAKEPLESAMKGGAVWLIATTSSMLRCHFGGYNQSGGSGNG